MNKEERLEYIRNFFNKDRSDNYGNAPDELYAMSENESAPIEVPFTEQEVNDLFSTFLED